MVELVKSKSTGELLYTREDKRLLIPSKEQYQNIIRDLAERNLMTTLIAVRMGCEMGMPRIELCNAEIRNIGREHKRGLYVDVAKKVKREGKFVMRSREIPINISLYSLLLNYIDKDSKYILKRERARDISKPFHPLHINYLYQKAGIPWSTHKSRHCFKNIIKDWMRTNRQMDDELMHHLMGHAPLDAHETYGSFSWDYKLEVIDKVFG